MISIEDFDINIYNNSPNKIATFILRYSFVLANIPTCLSLVIDTPFDFVIAPKTYIISFRITIYIIVSLVIGFLYPARICHT